MTNLTEARLRLETELREHQCRSHTHESPMVVSATSALKEASDHASERGAHEIDAAFVSGKSRRCVRIRKAIQRIDENRYGLCEKCGEDIPEKRLQADPAFENCVTCQEELDTLQQRMRPRAGTFYTQPVQIIL